jgi:hypothetical protein
VGQYHLFGSPGYNMSVTTTHPQYAASRLKWRRCRDVVEGQDALIQGRGSSPGGNRYIRPLAAQTEEEYRDYQERAMFFNATGRTVDALAGMIFAKDPMWKLPTAIAPFEQDITLSDITLREFTEQVVEQQLVTGRVGLMVDYPQDIRGALTVADAEALNVRPFLRWYAAETIINWRVGMVNGAKALTLVVLQEEIDNPKGEFDLEHVTQYRVLDLTPEGYRVRIIDERGEVLSEMLPLSNGRPLAFIPFIILGAFNAATDVQKPPLLDLVDTNLGHYRNAADYEHGLHFTGLPTPYVSGVQMQDGQTLAIGSMSAWVFPDPAAKAGYLEYSGDGLNTLRQAMLDKQAQMAVLGARMLAEEKRQGEAYQTMELRTAGERSVLASIARSCSDAMTRVLDWMAEWVGAPPGTEFSLNTDYGAARMQPQMLTSLMGAYQAGAMPLSVLFENMQRGELVRPDMEFEEYEAQLADASPEMAAPPADGDEEGLIAVLRSRLGL